MKKIIVEDLIRITGGKLICGKTDVECENYSKDTRTIKKGDVYIGIKGENFDGNSFFKEAVKKGAKVCILDNIEEKKIKCYEDIAIISVEDSVEALQKIAAYKRSLYDIPVVAITGSVGKTSTKDIIAKVLSEKFDVLKTEGNLNNQIGLPLTVLNLREHNAMVIEMGMNQKGEIERLSKIAKPTVAVITNIGTAHIGNLGSKENILKAKLEILEGMTDNGILVINNDDELLNKWKCEVCKDNNIITYGIKQKSDFNADKIELNEFESDFYIDKTKIHVPYGGLHFIYNALCAFSIGSLFKIDEKKISESIANFELSKSRMDIKKTQEGATIIDDCYNASYDSMKAAIKYLGNIKSKKRIAVLGDMLELGEFSADLHSKIGEDIYKSNIECLITIGKLSKYIFNKVDELNKNEKRVELFECETNIEAYNLIKKIMKKGDVLLFKASNGMNFKEIIGKLTISIDKIH